MRRCLRIVLALEIQFCDYGAAEEERWIGVFPAIEVECQCTQTDHPDIRSTFRDAQKRNECNERALEFHRNRPELQTVWHITDLGVWIQRIPPLEYIISEIINLREEAVLDRRDRLRRLTKRPVQYEFVYVVEGAEEEESDDAKEEPDAGKVETSCAAEGRGDESRVHAIMVAATRLFERLQGDREP